MREVYPIKELTPLPCTPSFVLGIINVRGQILTVIDLRRFFDLPIKGLTDLNKVIVIEHHEGELGVLADAILGVRSLCSSEIRPAPSTLTGVREIFAGRHGPATDRPRRGQDHGRRVDRCA